MLRRRNRLSLLAGVVSFLAMLSGCGGGGSVVDPVPMPPMDDTIALSGVPANHGLAPMEEFTVQPGASEEHGNVRGFLSGRRPRSVW